MPNSAEERSQAGPDALAPVSFALGLASEAAGLSGPANASFGFPGAHEDQRCPALLWLPKLRPVEAEAIGLAVDRGRRERLWLAPRIAGVGGWAASTWCGVSPLAANCAAGDAKG